MRENSNQQSAVSHQCSDDGEYVMFLNPDAFLIPESSLEKACALLKLGAEDRIGILGSKQLQYNLENRATTNIIDSTGIFQNVVWRCYDRLKEVGTLYETPESAADYLSTVFSDADQWRLREDVQIARKRFCHQYVRTDNYDGRGMLEIFQKELS